MVILDKLRIVGIRSFGPEEEDAVCIKFVSPVTLFLGQNGCGKTTIIEALKFACTGDLPPGCRQGSGFVHAPKLSRRVETRGQVKLSIKTKDGDTVTILKTVRVTQRLQKLEFKRLEYMLSRRKADGTKVCNVTSRCLDVNTDFLSEFGISKSILNYVVFCHQEDSNWPLDEPKQVKERFDEIFDATKYNKYLECLQKLTNDKVKNRKNLEIQMNAAKEIKNEVDKKKKKLKDDERNLVSLKETILQYEEEIEPKLIEIKEIEKTLLEFNTEKNNLILKKKQLEKLQEYRYDVEKNLDIIEDSDEKIEEMINTFSTEMKLKNKQLLETETEIQLKTEQEITLSSQISEIHVKIGRLEQEENEYKKKIEHRKEVINKVTKLLNINDYCDDESSVKTTLYNIKQKLNEKCKSRDCFMLESDCEQLELQNVIYLEREKKAKLEQEMKSFNKQDFNLKMNIRTIKHNLEEADATSSRLTEIDEKISFNDNKLTDLMNKFDLNLMTKEIESATLERNITEDQIEKVDKEIDCLTMLSNLQTELDLEQKTVANIKSEMCRFKNENEASLKRVLNNKVLHETFDDLFKVCEQKLKEEVSKLQMSISTLDRKLVATESEKTHIERKLKDALRLSEENTKLIKEQCDKKSFETVLQEIRKNLEETKIEKNLQKDSREVYKHFLKKLKQSDPCCPLCTRDFRDKPPIFVSEIIKGIEHKLSHNPSDLEDLEQKIVDYQKKYDNLLRLETVVKKNNYLMYEEIPTLKSDSRKTSTELNNIKKELEQLNKNIKFSEENLKIASSISNEVALFSNQKIEILKHTQRITKLQEQISFETSGRTLIEAQNNQKHLKIKAMDFRRKIESLQKQINIFNEEKQLLGETKNKLVAEKLRIQKNAQETVQLQNKLTELYTEEKKLSVELKEREATIIPIEQKIIELDTKMKELKYNNKIEIKSINEKISLIEKYISEINILQTLIDKFLKNDTLKHLNLLKEEVFKLESDKKSCMDLKQKLYSLNDSTKTFLNNYENVLKNFHQNLALRERIKEESKLKQEIDKLSKNFKIQNVDVLMNKRAELNKEIGSLCSKSDQLKGRKSELKKSIINLKIELNETGYLNANKRYLEKYLQLTMNDTIIKELRNFMEAYDLAMTVFHKQRMVLINKSIRELWTEIYRGNDCDYIEIRTDESPTVKNGRRSYNYKVIMLKKGVEIDMRGRCSAGQKVLASLVIRIALAEIFSSNCEILVLDEPTTNLDRKNIDSLSRALAELVEKKRNRKNFQLIIITHDRQFLEMLAIEDRVDKYFLVDRNCEGRSIVKEVTF